MRPDPTNDYPTAIDAIERALAIRYPPGAAVSLSELAALMDGPLFRESFPSARLLLVPAEVAEARATMLPSLLPFLHVPADSNFYAFDLDSPGGRRVAVWSDHAIVADWPTFPKFVEWVTEFLEHGTLWS
jgi:hypothetical protein